MTNPCLPRVLTLVLGLPLAACAVPAAETGPGAQLPEAVRAAAAPFQDLSGAELRADDGCYWYRHAGPVETTYLPLRTREGRPICARPQAPPAAGPVPAAGQAAASAG